MRRRDVRAGAETLPDVGRGRYPVAMIPFLPLETLPGWPTVESPSLIWWLTLLFGLPLLTGLVITIMVMGPKWSNQARMKEIEVRNG